MRILVIGTGYLGENCKTHMSRCARGMGFAELLRLSKIRAALALRESDAYYPDTKARFG